MGVEYKQAASEVLEDLETVIRRHPKFQPISDCDLRIALLMAWSDDDKPVKHHGFPAVAKIEVVKPEERVLGGPDVKIKIDAKRYNDRSPHARQAVLAHELYHIEFTYAGLVIQRDLYDRPAIKLRPDDYCINGFAEVAVWYGEDSAEFRSHRAVGEVLSQASLVFDGEPAEPETGDPIERVIVGAIDALVAVGHTRDQAMQLLAEVPGRDSYKDVPSLIEAVYKAKDEPPYVTTVSFNGKVTPILTEAAKALRRKGAKGGPRTSA